MTSPQSLMRVIHVGEVARLNGEPVMGVSPPLLLIEKAATSLVIWSVTYREVPDAARKLGPLPPVGNGEPPMAPSTPELASITKADTSFDPRLPTYSKDPRGLVVIATGWAPAGDGEPLIAFAVPLP